MQKEETYYSFLVSGFIDNTLPVEQVEELLAFIKDQPQWFTNILDSPLIKEKVSEFADHSNLYMDDAMSYDIWKRLEATVDKESLEAVVPVHRIHLLRRSWFRYAAVAILLIGLTTAIVFTVNRPRNFSETNIAKVQANDVKAPEKNKARITLADGKTISLDSLKSGLLAQQNNVKLVKLADGQIAYQSEDGMVVKELQYNTLSNPRGSNVIDMTLSDGSHVWLNAGSSVTYPVAFVGNERRVKISGEAYFEISHDASRPFKVGKADMEVTVLGTHFNVNAYDDESDIKVTLLEGSVKVTSIQHQESKSIRPGQQAVILSSNQQPGNVTGITVNSGVNLDEVMAWKNGVFNFNKLSLQEVLRQLSRWYDVEVVYEGNVAPKKFGGESPRNLDLSEILEGLQAIGMHFQIDGKKLIVMP